MPQHPSFFTDQVHATLQQYGAQGVDFHQLTEHFPRVDSHRLSKTLSNLQSRGLAHSEPQPGTRRYRWFVGVGERRAEVVTTTIHQRIRRARLQDQTDPLTYYGQGMTAPRASSVWAFASHFQEPRA